MSSNKKTFYRRRLLYFFAQSFAKIRKNSLRCRRTFMPNNFWWLLWDNKLEKFLGWISKHRFSWLFLAKMTAFQASLQHIEINSISSIIIAHKNKQQMYNWHMYQKKLSNWDLSELKWQHSAHPYNTHKRWNKTETKKCYKHMGKIKELHQFKRLKHDKMCKYASR